MPGIAVAATGNAVTWVMSRGRIVALLVQLLGLEHMEPHSRREEHRAGGYGSPLTGPGGALGGSRRREGAGERVHRVDEPL